ncbi:response regulator [Flavobacterium gelatinilyticum]|uniref:response regulator n=1 Tax=Flavobacterium gelatinilyticum TaxID=3003260 RepID=UPI00247FEF13|nr:response regulator [Flavobacterium gelatinilyticum]
MAVPKNTSRHIFIVDDDEDDRDFLADALLDVDPDAIIRQLEDGMYLMKSLLESKAVVPDLIFLDINRPGKSGLECLREIKMQDGNLKYVNVIMLSTSSGPSDIESARELGASFYAVKPNSFEVMRLFLSEVMKMDWNLLDNRKKFRLI